MLCSVIRSVKLAKMGVGTRLTGLALVYGYRTGTLISAYRLLSACYVDGFNPTLLSACDFLIELVSNQTRGEAAFAARPSARVSQTTISNDGLPFQADQLVLRLTQSVRY